MLQAIVMVTAVQLPWPTLSVQQRSSLNRF
jgi:hypothetical protein